MQDMYSMQGGMDYLYEALHGTAIRYAAEKRNPAESIAELRKIANGHDDILAEVAGITAGSWYASPVCPAFPVRQLVRQSVPPGCRLRGRPDRAGALDRGRERQSRRRLISWKAARCSRAASNRPRQGRRINPSSGEHDRVAAADGPAIDNRGVDADVHSVVLSGRPEDS
jgi:hypothetical protein